MAYVAGRSTKRQAATDALANIFNWSRSMAKYSGKKCGARLVILDGGLLIKPEELADKLYTAFVLKGKSPGGEDVTIYGVYQHNGFGKNLPIIYFNNKGEKICEGTYSLSISKARQGSGKFEVTCFSDQYTSESTGIVSFDYNSPVLTTRGQSSDGSDFEIHIGRIENY